MVQAQRAGKWSFWSHAETHSQRRPLSRSCHVVSTYQSTTFELLPAWDTFNTRNYAQRPVWKSFYFSLVGLCIIWRLIWRLSWKNFRSRFPSYRQWSITATIPSNQLTETFAGHTRHKLRAPTVTLSTTINCLIVMFSHPPDQSIKSTESKKIIKQYMHSLRILLNETPDVLWPME